MFENLQEKLQRAFKSLRGQARLSEENIGEALREIGKSIKDHTLSLTNIVTQVRDVEGPSADTLKQCVEQKSAGLTSVAADQADLTDYGIGITFGIP